MRPDELEKLMLSVFSELRPDLYVEMESRIKEDLNLDSLEVFRACVEIEEQTKMEVCKYISNEILTIEDLFTAITDKRKSKFNIDYAEYPKAKNLKRLKEVIKWLNKIYDIEIIGIENIDPERSQIICPNHESNYDPFMVITALYLNGIDIEKFCCFASEDVWNSKIMRTAFDLLGAIPVFRTENSSLALRRAKEILSGEDVIKLLIHPEGKRTRDGKLGVFKYGAATLSETTGTEIIPVCLNGTGKVYPYGRKIPKLCGHEKIQVIFLPAVEDGNIMKVRDAIKAEKDRYMSER